MNTSDYQTGLQAAYTEPKPFLARFMALGDIEWQLAQAEPRLFQELRFQVTALMMCAPSFGIAVFNVAINLLGYPLFAAAMFAVMAAFGLYSIDRHFLIQGRGAGEDTRGSIIKVRVGSLVIISISFALMATHSFRGDIERLLSEEGDQQRIQLSQSQLYKVALESARENVRNATDTVNRAAELQKLIASAESKKATALAEERNECEGNVTGNQVRIPGCGRKARGYAAEAERLKREIKVARDELNQLGNVFGQQTLTQSALQDINARIEEAVKQKTQGVSKRLDMLFELVLSNASALIAVLFWIAVGMLPDMLMWFAQGRSFNHDVFTNMRVVEREGLDAGLVRLRAGLRRQTAEELLPIEVHLAVTTQPAMVTRSDSSRDAPAKAMAGELQ